MKDRKEIIDELKHLVKYHAQAVIEFFDEANTEMKERDSLVYDFLEKDEGSFDDIERFVELLEETQKALGERIKDLEYLTGRMRAVLSGKEEESGD